MKLVQLEVQNFCQHRHRIVDFSPRLTAFLGQNGSGKSNLLTAALGALTNDFSRTHGNKAENICQTAPEDEPSFVRLTFEHGGVEVTVQRGLRKSQSYWEQGEDRVRGDRAVTERVTEFLGTSKRIVNDYIFVEQGEIFTPLVCKEADRARAFQQLFGTEHAERCWKAAGELLSSIPTEVSALDIDSLNRELQAAQERVSDIERQLGEIDLPDDYSYDNDPAKDIVDAWSALTAANTSRDTLADGIDKLQSEVDDLTASTTHLQGEFAAVEEALRSTRDAHAAAEAALQTWEFREMAAARLETNRQLHAALLEEEAAHPMPAKPADYIEDLEEWRTHTGTLTAKHHKYEDMVAALNPDAGVVECPTCGTPVADLEMDIEYARAKVGKLEAEIADRQASETATRGYNEELGLWRTWEASWTSRSDSIASAIETDAATAQQSDLSEEKRAEYQKLVDNVSSWVTAKADITKDLASSTAILSSKDSQLTADKEACSKLEKRIAELLGEYPDISEEVAAEAATTAATNVQLYHDTVRLQGKRDEAVIAAENAANRVVRAEESVQRAARNVEFSAHVAAVRDILHRDNLPKLVAQNYLELLETDINEILELFGVDFRASAVDGLGFMVDFPDGRSQPAPRLSGGQKVVLALAFRIAVNSLFASDLGVIALDEPTAYLDDENIGCLDAALSRLRNLSEARGLQCILITHERGLGHLFDHVVQL